MYILKVFPGSFFLINITKFTFYVHLIFVFCEWSSDYTICGMEGNKKSNSRVIYQRISE